MRILLVALFVIAIIGDGATAQWPSSATLASSCPSAGRSSLLTADLLDISDDHALHQALPLTAFTNSLASIQASHTAPPRYHQRQTNRHRQRDDLFTLNLALLI